MKSTPGDKHQLKSAYQQFCCFSDIQADPNASSVGWLCAQLDDMANTLASAGQIEVFDPAQQGLVCLRSLSALTHWAHCHFPVTRWRAK